MPASTSEPGRPVSASPAFMESEQAGLARLGAIKLFDKTLSKRCAGAARQGFSGFSKRDASILRCESQFLVI